MREFAAHTGSRTDRPIMWTHPTIREAYDKDFSEHTAAIELDIAEVMRKYGVNAAWSAKVLTLPPPASIICSGIWRCFSLSPSERKKTMTPATQHRVVSRDEWLKARTALLTKEKEFTRLRDQLSAQKRALPWVRIDKEYIFDGPNGKVTLAGLFDGRSQLFIKHFMMGPGASTQCVGCSFEVDHVEGILAHLQNHEVTYAVVARAPIEEIEVVRKRMGWKFPWVSSYHSDFNYDFNVSFTPEQVASGRAVYNFQKAPEWAAGLQDLSGDSVFFKDSSGQIYLTYATFGRGGEEFLGAYRILDVMPKGRNENGPYHSLGDWVRPNNMYGQGGFVEPNGRYHQPECGCAVDRTHQAQ